MKTKTEPTMTITHSNYGVATRQFNAIPWLAYWDIYKNYYANKQEGIGAVIHQNPIPVTPTLTAAQLFNGQPTGIAIPVGATPFAAQSYLTNPTTYLRINCTGLTANLSIEQILFAKTATTRRNRISGLNGEVDARRCQQ